MRRHLLQSLLVVVLLCAAGRTATATQILIGPGQHWEEAVRKAKPGDEIILMPGEHRAALLEDLNGTAEQPIIIRGLDASNPAIIVANRYGLRLIRSRHVTLQHLVIRDAEIGGLYICGADETASEDVESSAEPYGHIKLENVYVLRTGPKRKRHAVEVVGVRNIDVLKCRIEGWGGSGFEIVGCDDVTIDQSRFIGVEKYGQNTGVRIRAGSTNVTITNNRFQDTGLAGLCVGGSSVMQDFPETILNDARTASIFEARHVLVERNIFIRGASSIIMTHSDRTDVMRNTIIDPQHFVFCLIKSSDNDLIGQTRRCTFSRNMITWQKDAMQKYFLLDAEIDLMTLKLDSNLWWSTESLDARTRLGRIPNIERSPQVAKVDPKLDADLAPTTLEASGYGALPLRIARPGGSQIP